MSQRNKIRTKRMYSLGASLGRIAKALNVTVMAVAYVLAQGGAA